MTSKILEERLIQFAIPVVKLSENLKPTTAGKRLADQIVRSGTSSALNYGEVQSAESPRDLVHKMGICLKELRETFINLRIIEGAKLHPATEILSELLKENNELISIFVKSIETSKKKRSGLNR